MAPPNPTDEPHPRPPHQFATTSWSIVLTAAAQTGTAADEALEQLCTAYWYPLYAYARRRVSQVDEAQDLTQAFFTELLQKNYLAAADPQRGRFRAFLLTAFKHFLSKQWDKAKAQKRGGNCRHLPLDFAAAESRVSLEPAQGLTPEQLYERQWALALLDRVIDHLESEYCKAAKHTQFDRLKAFLVGDRTGTTYAHIADALNMTEAAVKMAVHRMRHRYRELLREEIAQTVADPADVDDEIRSLFRTFSQ